MTLEQMLENVEEARNELRESLDAGSGGFHFYECLTRAEQSLNNAHHWLQEAIDAKKDN